MEDMIAKIVDMDKKARSLNSEMQKSKVNCDQEISEIREKIREEYLEQARERIEMNREIENKNTDIAFEEIKGKYSKISDNIDSIYKKNFENWVDTIVKRVIEE